MPVITTILAACLLGANFPICTYSEYQIYPCARYENNQYYVFWTDYRSDPVISLTRSYPEDVLRE